MSRIADDEEFENAEICKIAEVMEFRTSVEEVGLRLDQFLVAKMPDRTRSQVQDWIESGRVLLQGRPSKASQRLKVDQEVLVEVPHNRSADPIPQGDIPLDIIYEDQAIIVINKQMGLVVHPAASCADGTLVNALLHHCQDLSGIRGVEKPGIVHRLDKDTTGLMVVAKNDQAHLGLSLQFENRTVTKIYEALCHGFVSPGQGRINQPIKRHGIDRIRMSVNPQGKQAITDYQAIAFHEYRSGSSRPVQRYSHVELHLRTGRTHQIRVHMAHNGYPLVGDPVYGKRDNPFGVEGQLLHCKRLSFQHPLTHQTLEFEAERHQDFAKVMRTLEEYARNTGPESNFEAPPPQGVPDLRPLSAP